MRRALMSLGAGLLVIAMSACGKGEAESAAGADLEIPEFEGPYAAEFAEAYRDATTDFERSVLADGEISDAEYAEMVERFRGCLELEGITLTNLEPDGSFETTLAPHGGDTNEIITQCGTSTGQDTIGLIHDLIAFDPDNRDVSELMAECLVRQGVVDSDYDAEAYDRDIEGRFAETASMDSELRDAYIDCSKDPYGKNGS